MLHVDDDGDGVRFVGLDRGSAVIALAGFTEEGAKADAKTRWSSENLPLTLHSSNRNDESDPTRLSFSVSL